MVEWWLTLSLTVASGLIALVAGLVSGYFSHRWGMTAGREAEERQAERRAHEEQREAVRRFRRERIQPIISFLDAAKRFRARDAVEDQVEKTFKDKPEDQIHLDVKQALKDKSIGDDPDIFQLMRALFVASASAPSSEIRGGAVFRVLVAAITPREKASESLDDATSAAEEIIEKYLTVV